MDKSEANESSGLDASKAIEQILNGANAIANRVANAGIFDRTDFSNPLDQLQYKREKIDKDYDSWQSDAINSAYALAGLQDSYQQKMDELNDAQRYSEAGDKKFSADSNAQQQKHVLQQYQGSLDAAAASEGKTEFQREQEAVEQNYKNQLEAANQVENRTFQSQGFNSQADADAYAAHVRQAATAVHNAESDKLARSKMAQQARDQSQLDALNQLAAGDTTGATRTMLESQLDSQELAIDPNDKERLQRFNDIRQKTLDNFDAESGRQKKFQEAQSDDNVAKYREEAQEAELRSQGKDDEAKIDALRFSIEQRTKSLREQADAEVDPSRKAQLEREADASAAAEKPDVDALRQQLQRESQAGNPNTNSLRDNKDPVPGLSDVAKKLDDAATKLDKAFANAKTVVLLKD